MPAAEIAYVSDRVDNDVLLAKEAGIAAIFLRRGRWGVIQAAWPERRRPICGSKASTNCRRPSL